MYGCEKWSMTKNSKIMWNKRRGTILEVYEAVTAPGLWRIRINQELREVYNTSDHIADSKAEDWNGWGM
jgi:hypothetical protein